MWGRGISIGLFVAAIAAAQTPVIVISVDTLRADHLSAYGYKKQETPNFDAFARGGTLFESVDSQIPLTLPSHTTLFTSTYPFENKVEENDEVVPAGAVTLASVLRSHGYKTAAFVGSILMDARKGLNQGFDDYDSPFHSSSEAANPYAAGVRRDGAWVLRGARQWLSEHHDRPVFVFVHLFDLHAPYSVGPNTEGLPNAAAYDAEIEYVDRLLGQFREALEQGGWWDHSLVVLLSDHGESLDDHGETSHGYFVYQSTLHVPLMVHWPRATAGYEARCAQPGGLIDVAPTILDFLKIPPPRTFEGASLLPAARGAKDDGRAVYSESMYARDAFGWAPLRSLRSGALQYIDAPKPELYDLRGDPGEARNLVSQDAAQAHDLQARLTALLSRASKRPAAGVDSSAASRRALESLGYLGHTAKKSVERPDPKDRLTEYDLYESALAEMYGGKPRSAIAEFQHLLSHDRRNSLARYYLADAYLRAKQPDAAIREWNDALKFDPTYVPAAEALGAWWMGREDYPKARGALLKAVAMAPQDSAALMELGKAEEHMGLLQDALLHLQSACKAMPASAECAHELQAVKSKFH